jgi:anti-sigma-K factor RsiG
MTMPGKRKIDRILAGDYLAGLESKPMPDVRVMRAESEEEEASLSYERRLLQGRIDILEAELNRRSGGGASLMELLPKILADDHPSSRGAYPRRDPTPATDRPKRHVEKLISDDTLTNLSELSDDRVREAIVVLREAEREVSSSRHAVQQVLDRLQAEIARRYKSGEADPADILVGP